MSTPKLGRLVRVELREVWKREAANFTQWLALPENLELLGETIGFELADPRTEVGVGAFRVDLVAKDAITDRVVVIENQLEATNHDHLGKVLTYAAGHDAESAVWIVKEARDEHRRAIEWLNEHTTQDVNFFLIEAQAWRIGDSEPAPVFEIISRPNDWARQQKQSSSDAALDFDPEIQAFYERVREHGTSVAKNINRWRPASARRWYDVSIGSSRAHIALRVTKQQNRVSVELYIDDSKELFAMLVAEREFVESALGMSLEWNELPNKKASRIIATHPGSFADAETVQDLVVWLVETADAFAGVFPRYL